MYELQKNFEIFSVAQSSDFWKNRDYMSRLGGGMDKKTNFIEMFIVKMYFHFKTLSMLIMCAETLSYDV